jgi:hypothetical protein
MSEFGRKIGFRSLDRLRIPREFHFPDYKVKGEHEGPKAKQDDTRVMNLLDVAGSVTFPCFASSPVAFAALVLGFPQDPHPVCYA